MLNSFIYIERVRRAARSDGKPTDGDENNNSAPSHGEHQHHQSSLSSRSMVAGVDDDMLTVELSDAQHAQLMMLEKLEAEQASLRAQEAAVEEKVC